MTQATEKDIGKWCKFWDYNKKVYIIGKLKDYVKHRNGKFSDYFYNAYFKCIPLTQEQIKVLGLEE